MRAFRNSLMVIWAVCLTASASTATADADPLRADRRAEAGPTYYPLAVGNSWHYRCSVDGEFQFSKHVNVRSQADAPRTYLLETKVSTDKALLRTYAKVSATGTVTLSHDLGGAPAEALISATPKVGEKFGAFSVVQLGMAADSRYRGKPQVRLETFAVDDPSVSEEQRLQWRGRVFVQGVGLVEEADGLGGACMLSSHTLVRPRK